MTPKTELDDLIDAIDDVLAWPFKKPRACLEKLRAAKKAFDASRPTDAPPAEGS